MKIALVQQSATANINSNIKKGMDNAEIASKNGANIICFSELAFTPFYPQTIAKSDYLKLAVNIPGPYTEPFQKMAKKFGVVIILNLFERLGEKAFDSSPVINTDGTILGITRMIHITDYPCFHEKGYYSPGENELKVYKTEFGKIGIAICYDRHYPEYMRALAIKGAELVFIPQAGAIGEWPDGLYEAEIKVASFQNGYYTALCNRVGEEKCLTFAGESFVCNPEGKVIARANHLTEEILYADLDLKMVEESHAKRLFIKDRRPELYKNWI